MNIDQLIEQLQRVKATQPNRNWRLVVKVFQPCSIGGSPCVEVERINIGFDWDAGKVLVETQTPLTALCAGDVAAIHKSAKEGQSWHAYQQYEKHAAQVKILKAEIAALKIK